MSKFLIWLDFENHDVAIGLIANVQVRQSLPKPDNVQNMVTGYVPFDIDKWISLRVGPEVVNVNNKMVMLVSDPTEKSFMKPSTEASRLAFEKELDKRWLLLQSKPLINHNVRHAVLM